MKGLRTISVIGAGGEKGAAYLLYLTDSCVYNPPNTLTKQFFDEHPQMLHVQLKLKLILQKESV